MMAQLRRLSSTALVLAGLIFGAGSAATTWAQCSNAALKPVWDGDKGEFRCADPEHPEKAQKEAALVASGDKASCGTVRDNLQTACAAGSEGKTCRSEAKSIYNSCYKKTKTGTDATGAAPGPGSLGSKTDPSVCMDTFRQQQQLCNARKLPPPTPGQAIPQDTCLQDAVAAQNKCLANSH